MLGHLIHADRTDWMTRLDIILKHGPDLPFDRFDREAQSRQDQSKTLDALLDEFRVVRADNLRTSRQLGLTPISLNSRVPIPTSAVSPCANFSQHGPRMILPTSCKSAERWRKISQ